MWVGRFLWVPINQWLRLDRFKIPFGSIDEPSVIFPLLPVPESRFPEVPLSGPRVVGESERATMRAHPAAGPHSNPWTPRVPLERSTTPHDPQKKSPEPRGDHPVL